MRKEILKFVFFWALMLFGYAWIVSLIAPIGGA